MPHQFALLTPLENLTNAYGQRFELICDRHKLFLIAALTDSLLYKCSMAESWDEIDPQAFLPVELTKAFNMCDWLSQAEKLNLIRAISEQLNAAANRPID